MGGGAKALGMRRLLPTGRQRACNSGAVWATEAGSRQHPDMHLVLGKLGSTAKVDLVLACRVSLQVGDCHSGQGKVCFHKYLYLSPTCTSELDFVF